MKKILFLIIVDFLAIGVLPLSVFASMSSDNYSISADSIGFNTGGNLASGDVYTLQDTVGETAASSTASANYQVLGGYQSMETGTLSITFSSAAVALGTLSATQLVSATTVATVTCDSTTGYTLAISSVSGNMPAGVADGAVTAGSEEYGVAVTGSDAAYSNDRAPVSGLTLASSASPTYQTPTTLTFKASINNNSVAGNYSQSLTITASANF